MDFKSSNFSVSNITRINNFNINDLDNIIYLNNTIHTDVNNNFNLDISHSNSTFYINNINQPIYKKQITQTTKYPLQLFHSNNHNLKINDIITLQNVNILNNNLANNFVLYKVIETTRNTFRLETFNNYDNTLNNIINIFKTSSKLNNSYFCLYSNKTYKQILSINAINKITLRNHTFSINDIVQFENFNYINTLYSNSQFKITQIQSNMITLVDTLNNNTDLFTQFPINFNNNNIYIKLIHSTNLNKTLHITLPNINSVTNLGSFYNFVINTPLTSFSISTYSNDIASGTTKISSSDLITSDLIFSTDNSNHFSINNINLLHSKISIINIDFSKWFIECTIPNNIINYKVSLDNAILINNEVNQNLSFFTNFLYEFDLSDPSLLNNHFILVDIINNHIIKNSVMYGIIGKPNAKLQVYFDDSFPLNSTISVKYKRNVNNPAFYYVLLATIRPFINPFSIQ